MKDNSRHYLIIMALLFVALTYSLVTIGKLYPDFNVSHLITAGDYFVNDTMTPTEIAVLKDSVGYDGQFYYRLALDPFTNLTTAFGVTLDNPSFRQQRIGYPLVVWALSHGNPVLVPMMLVVVNIIAAMALGGMGGKLAIDRGQPGVVGSVFAFYPGFAVSYFRDLAEIMTAALVLAGILYGLRGRHLIAALFFGASVATRETALLVPASFGMVHLFVWVTQKHNLRSHSWYVYLLPLLVYFSIRYYVGSNWGTDSLSGGLKDLGLPLVGITEFLRANYTLESPLQVVNIAAFLLCCATAVLGAFSLRTSQVPAPIKLSWLLYLILITSLSNVLWLSFGEFLRACNEYWLITCLLIIYSNIPLQRTIAVAVVTGWLGLSIVIL